MSRNYDAIVVGAGSVGVPTALFLTLEGLKVLVLNSDFSAGQGQNKSAIGGVRATHSDPAKIYICKESLRIFSEWENEYGHDIAWKKGGYCFPVYRDQEEKILKAILPIQKKHNLNIDWVQPDKIKEIVPGINPKGLQGGTYSPDDGQVSPLLAIEAMEKAVPLLIDMGRRARKSGSPFVSMPLHKGPDGFMSLEQYKTFYWPTLRKVMVGLIDEGLVPMPFFEGDNTSRLEVIKDIPRGKAVYRFERVDIYKAKEILGDTVCFRGNVPISLISTGTTEEVEAYVKELIDVVGKDGGLMVDFGSIVDEGKHENVKAMIEYTKAYGRYE